MIEIHLYCRANPLVDNVTLLIRKWGHAMELSHLNHTHRYGSLRIGL